MFSHDSVIHTTGETLPAPKASSAFLNVVPSLLFFGLMCVCVFCGGFKALGQCVCDLDLYKLRGSFTLVYYSSFQSQSSSTCFFLRP